jgi:hypothetical protein
VAGKDLLPDEVPRQLRDRAAGVCLAYDRLDAGDFLQSAWEVIACDPSGWTGIAA